MSIKLGNSDKAQGCHEVETLSATEPSARSQYFHFV